MVKRSLHLDEIAYCPDSCDYFERLRDLPGAALLDSSFPHTGAGRYDILTAGPAPFDLPPPPGLAAEADARAFFDHLAQCHREHYAGIRPVSPDIPFSGGVLGFLGYDLGNALHGVPGRRDTEDFPPAALRAYDWCLVQDHLLRRAVVVTQPGVSARRRRDLLARLEAGCARQRPDFRLTQRFAADLDRAEYVAAFERIQAYIHAGDCYQVNLARRFSAAFDGDPWMVYRALRGVAAAPFAAYLPLDDGGALMSLSPERFLALHGHRVETSPIKGTRPRYADSVADALAARELRASDKDRAENLMIVDLLRNDLGRSCVPGSIHVDRLFEVQSFSTVHHLVSTVSGELVAERGPWELLRDCFPGGSITGAPKRRAMQIIAELETGPRRAYCGSVLYVSADGRMDSNIAIRSLLAHRGRLHCWAGGGIVADSGWQEEYRETWDKVGRFLQVVEREFTG